MASSLDIRPAAWLLRATLARRVTCALVASATKLFGGCGFGPGLPWFLEASVPP
jgi:hypothetical protein